MTSALPQRPDPVTQAAAPATPPPPARPPFLDAFSRILLDLRICVGERMKAAPALMPLALALLLDGRLQRLRNRFVALAERALAGTLRPPRVRPTRGGPMAGDAAGDPAGDAPARPGPERLGPARLGPERLGPERLGPEMSLSRAAGLLLVLCPRDLRFGPPRPLVSDCRFRLARLIEEDAAFRTLITSDRRFGRLLRPLFHLITAEPLPAWLQLPPRERKPRPPRDRGAGPGVGRGERATPSRRRNTGRRSLQDRDGGPATTPPPVEPAPAQALPYAQIPDWTPTELTREPRPARNRYLTRPPLIFRSLW
jgi:hypothetical protein